MSSTPTEPDAGRPRSNTAPVLTSSSVVEPVVTAGSGGGGGLDSSMGGEEGSVTPGSSSSPITHPPVRSHQHHNAHQHSGSVSSSSPDGVGRVRGGSYHHGVTFEGHPPSNPPHLMSHGQSGVLHHAFLGTPVSPLLGTTRTPPISPSLGGPVMLGPSVTVGRRAPDPVVSVTVGGHRVAGGGGTAVPTAVTVGGHHAGASHQQQQNLSSSSPTVRVGGGPPMAPFPASNFAGTMHQGIRIPGPPPPGGGGVSPHVPLYHASTPSTTASSSLWHDAAVRSSQQTPPNPGFVDVVVGGPPPPLAGNQSPLHYASCSSGGFPMHSLATSPPIGSPSVVLAGGSGAVMGGTAFASPSTSGTPCTTPIPSRSTRAGSLMAPAGGSTATSNQSTLPGGGGGGSGPPTATTGAGALGFWLGGDESAGNAGGPFFAGGRQGSMSGLPNHHGGGGADVESLHSWSSSNASSIREGLPLCPEDASCSLVNDRQHQRRFSHTCRLHPCYHAHLKFHTRLFRHDPGQCIEQDPATSGSSTTTSRGRHRSKKAVASVTFTSISQDAPNATKMTVVCKDQAYDIYGDWANVKVHTFRRYLHQVLAVPPVAQKLLLNFVTPIDDDLASVAQAGVSCDPQAPPSTVVVMVDENALLTATAAGSSSSAMGSSGLLMGAGGTTGGGSFSSSARGVHNNNSGSAPVRGVPSSTSSGGGEAPGVVGGTTRPPLPTASSGSPVGPTAPGRFAAVVGASTPQRPAMDML